MERYMAANMHLTKSPGFGTMEPEDEVQVEAQ
jgi:hypothetical protein